MQGRGLNHLQMNTISFSKWKQRKHLRPESTSSLTHSPPYFLIKPDTERETRGVQPGKALVEKDKTEPRRSSYTEDQTSFKKKETSVPLYQKKEDDTSPSPLIEEPMGKKEAFFFFCFFVALTYNAKQPRRSAWWTKSWQVHKVFGNAGHEKEPSDSHFQDWVFKYSSKEREREERRQQCEFNVEKFFRVGWGRCMRMIFTHTLNEWMVR